MKNLLAILDGELADGRTTLMATSCDIERAAAFCNEDYMKVPKTGKLENTMALATQSLGTVAYHISRLASHFLDAVELQSSMLSDISDSMEKLKMVCNAHQEKVARKAIGSCTNPKVPINFQREFVPPEAPQKYLRRPIDFSILDSIGHGVRLQEPLLNQYGMPISQSNTLQRRGSSSTGGVIQGRQHRTISCHTSGSIAGSEYAAPVRSGSNARYQTGTVGRTAGIYRTTGVPPHHLMGAMVTGAHQPSTGSGGSPVSGQFSSIGYAPSHEGFPTSHTPVDVTNSAALLTSQSGRSSGSSSVAGHYAMNQQIQQGYTAVSVPSNHVQMQQKIPGQFIEQGMVMQTRMMQQPPFSAPLTMAMPVHPTQSTVAAIQQAENMAAQHQLNQQRYQQQMPQYAQRNHSHLPVQPVVTTEQTQAHGQEAMVHDATREHAGPISAPQIAHASPNSLSSTDHSALPPPDAYAGPPTSHSQQFTLPEPQLLSNEAPLEPPSGTCLIARKSTDPAWAPDFYMEKVITLYEYLRDKDDELTFTENQIIYVVKKNDDGWWEGIMNGITGLFPGNYVEVID